MLRDFTKEKFDIIIQAGQSNSEGYGFGDTDNPYVPNDRVWYMRAPLKIQRTENRRNLFRYISQNFFA